MQIAELFVSLGVKGNEKTISAITNVKAGLSNVASTSLEAKAAIVGAMYALQHFMSESSARGTVLSNFNAQTDISVKTLQQWEYAASRAGASNEEFLGTVKTVYDKIAQIKLNKGTPEYLGILATHVAGFDIKKAYDEKTGAFYILTQLQKLAQMKNLSKDIINQVINSFGVSDNVKSALFKNEFNENNFKKAPIYSDKEVQNLNKVNVMWSDIGRQIQMAFGHFTAAHGGQLASDISKIITEVFKLVNALDALAQRVNIFQLIGDAFKGWTTAISGLTDLIKLLFPKNEKEEIKAKEGLNKNPLVQYFTSPDKESIAKANSKKAEIDTNLKILSEGTKDFLNSIFGGKKKNITQKEENQIKESRKNYFGNHYDESQVKSFLNSVSNYTDKKRQEGIKNLNNDNTKRIIHFQNPKNSVIQLQNPTHSIEPKVPVINHNNQSSKTQNIEINQNLTFQHDGKDHNQTKSSVKSAISDAYKQFFAQSQAT